MGRAVAALALLAASVPAQPDFRPVVLTGEQTPRLLGASPEEIAAFVVRDGALVPVPVQVDERFVYDLASAYPPGFGPRDCPRRVWCRDLRGQVVEVGYADPDTYVGADPDPALDALDEIALMLRDFGEATDADPPGMDAATRTVVKAAAGGAARYTYLYRRTAPALRTDTSYVRYDIAFERGPYLATYDHGGRMPRSSASPTASRPATALARTPRARASRRRTTACTSPTAGSWTSWPRRAGRTCSTWT